uniref:Reverse transcriptase/retrotransposon-derived protein RNase H-like domain-containing protein n=1 Tax=Amphimedon queenslandica TaxID=400682 RepID=A0A1X7VFS1_AMPQE
MSEVVYLGHKIGREQVKSEVSNIAAVRDYPKPMSKTDVRSFLRLVGYYWKFIPHFASVAAPFSDFTKKNLKVFDWTGECDQAFILLKILPCDAPVLRSPNLNKEMILQMDPSNRGVGAVLSQLDNDGVEHPLVYASRKLLPKENRYSIVEKNAWQLCGLFRPWQFICYDSSLGYVLYILLIIKSLIRAAVSLVKEA